MFTVKWKNFCACQKTWEPKAHLPSELIEAFENPEPDPLRVEKARERIGLVFERGMKVPLQHEELPFNYKKPLFYLKSRL